MGTPFSVFIFSLQASFFPSIIYFCLIHYFLIFSSSDKPIYFGSWSGLLIKGCASLDNPLLTNMSNVLKTILIIELKKLPMS